ncbi:MAG: ABC transporter permease, partial [Verrucomicrobiota bacterium]
MSAIPGIIWRACLWAGTIGVLASFATGFTPLGPDVVPYLRWPGAGLLLLAALFGVIDYGWTRFWHELNESLRIAFAQIRANKLRSALTALGVIIGIVAVTLMGTAIIGIDAGVESTLSGLGDDVLYVSKWPWKQVDDWWNLRNRRDVDITYATPMNDYIAAHPDSALKIAVPAVNWNATVMRGEYRVSNINIVGTGADLGRIVRSDMKEGRFFTEIEAKSGRNVAVIGFDVADALFPGDSPLGKTLRIRNQQYT